MKDEVLSFLPLCHVFEQLFSVMGHITHGYTVNFIENLETVTDNMIEIFPHRGVCGAANMGRNTCPPFISACPMPPGLRNWCLAWPSKTGKKTRITDDGF